MDTNTAAARGPYMSDLVFGKDFPYCTELVKMIQNQKRRGGALPRFSGDRMTVPQTAADHMGCF